MIARLQDHALILAIGQINDLHRFQTARRQRKAIGVQLASLFHSADAGDIRNFQRKNIFFSRTDLARNNQLGIHQRIAVFHNSLGIDAERPEHQHSEGQKLHPALPGHFAQEPGKYADQKYAQHDEQYIEHRFFFCPRGIFNQFLVHT